jgi:hypothetical protein
VRLFEGVRELQHAEVVAVASDDLPAQQQASGVKPAGTEIAGMAGDRDVVAALHPVE